jgi:hypothetical protein
MKRQEEEEGKERGERRKKRCKEGEDNDEEQGGVNSKKIKFLFSSTFIPSLIKKLTLKTDSCLKDGV